MADQYSDTGAIINVVGIKDPYLANLAYERTVAMRMADIQKNPELIRVRDQDRFGLKQQQKIHAVLHKGFMPDKALGKLRQRDLPNDRGPGLSTPHRRIAEESRRLQLSLSAAIADRTRGQRLALNAAAQEIAKYLQQAHALSPFPRGNFPVQIVVAKEIARSVGYEIKLGQDLKHVQLLMQSRQMERLAQVLEKSLVRMGPKLAPTVSVEKSQKKILEKRQSLERNRARHIAIERARGLEYARTLGLNLGPSKSVVLSPDMKAAQEKFRAMQPELSPGQRLALERGAEAEKKAIEKAIEMVRAKEPELAKTLEKKLTQERQLSMGPPTPGRALAKGQQISKGLTP